MKFVRWFVVFIVIAGAGYGWWSYSRANSAAAADAAAEPTITAERRDIEASLLLTGEVTPAFQVEVKAEVGGKIKSLNVVVGQTVRKGEVLAVIDDTDLLSEKANSVTEIDGTQLALEKARGNYERAKALFDAKLISKEVYSNLQSDFEIAQNEVDKANRRLQIVEDKLGKTRILAPADGTVLDIPVNEGLVVSAAGSVNSGTVIMNFADLTQLLVYTQVNQVDAPRLKVDQKVEISAGDGSEIPVRAHVQSIAPLAKVKNNVKGFEVRVAIDDNDGRMRPGVSVSMNVPVGHASNVVSVPVTAVFQEQRNNIVFVRNDGGAPEKRQVTVGLTDLSYAEIKKGVKEGDTVLLVQPTDLQNKS